MAEKIKKEKYIEGIGRRKTSVARVRITPSTRSSFSVNEKTVDDYFNTEKLRQTALSPLETESLSQKFHITAHVTGGGITGQAESVRLGLSRALIEFNEELRGQLKKKGFLKRDPRVKERRKFGLKKARKAPQWSKR